MKRNSIIFINFLIISVAMLFIAFVNKQETSFEKTVKNQKKYIDLNSLMEQRYYKFSDTITNDKNVKRISDSLERMNQRLPIEKVYLHTDKPIYTIGDTIWFKAYLVDHATHMASTISNVLYVELVDEDARLVERVSIRIKDGKGWGQIPIRKIQYQDGGYMLRAYTMWTQNFINDFFFSQRFFISTQTEDAWIVKSNAAIELIDNKDQLQISLSLSKLGKSLSPVALKDVEVKIYDDIHPIFSEEMRTGLDGSLKFTRTLKDRMNGRRMRIQIMSLEAKDNNKIVQVPLVINRNSKIDLQFLPEGGKLVAGIKSIVGFKAVGEDGRGIQVSGGIFDSKGNRITGFTTLHAGMGSIEITPKANEIYTARIDEPMVVMENYPLPKPEPIGTVLHISNLENAEDIKITLAGLNGMPSDSGFYIIGTARGKMRYSKKIVVGQTELSVAKKLFPSGVIRFTLFNGIRPLNERIVFIDHQDRLHVKITPNKSHYDKRDSVSFTIEIKDKNNSPVRGNFSLSVTDDSQVKPDSVGDYGIAASLLINSDLKGDNGITVMKYFRDFKFKGEIESPGYYVNRKDSTAWKALDNLMLTQGWTDYKWEKVFSGDKPIYFKAQNTFDITGKVTNILKKNMTNTVVLAFSQKPPFVKKTLTDKSGIFAFKDLLEIDSGSFFFQGTKPNGKPMGLGEIIIDRPFNPYPILAAYRYPILPWYVNSDTTQINQAKRKAEKANANNPEITGTLLKEVEIRGKKIIRASWNPYGPGNADYIFDENDIKRSGLNNLYDFFMQNIPGIRIYGSFEVEGINQLGMTFNHRVLDTKIDGRLLKVDFTENEAGNIEELSKYQLASIRGIELIYSSKYTGWSSAQPKLVITTYTGNGGVKDFKASTNAYRPLPITPSKVFYSPKYSIKSSEKMPDYRATVHWEPNITTDKNGKATVSFYTSDSTGGLTFNLQGMSLDGSMGSLLYMLKHQ